KNLFSNNLVRPNRRRRDEVAGPVAEPVEHEKFAGYSKCLQPPSTGEKRTRWGKFDSFVEAALDSQILCCSDGPGEFDNTLPLWTSLWTDMTLKSFAKELAKKDSAQFFPTVISRRGLHHRPGHPLAVAKPLKKRERIRRRLSNCPAITKNSIAHLFRTFSSASVVKTDIADKMDDDDLKKNKGSLLFVSLPEVQFSAMSAVKEGKLKAAGGRGRGGGRQIHEGWRRPRGGDASCACRYFPSQPDQVVIVVLNDFDRAVGHIAETLVTYLSKGSQTATRRKLATASDASIPNIPDKPKVDRKGGADVEADDKIEMVKGPEYHHVGVKQVEKMDPPNGRCNSMFVSNNELDIRKPSSVFSVVVADCKECTVGLIRMDPKWFEFSQKFHSFRDLYERAIVKLEFSDSGKEFHVHPATWKTDTFVSDKDNFVVSIEVRKGALSGESNMVNIVLNKATVHQFIVKSSALSRRRLSPKEGQGVADGARRRVRLRPAAPKARRDDVGFYLLPDSASPVYSSVGAAPGARLGEVQVSAGAEATSSAAVVESDPSVGTPLHTPPFRVLCHRMSSSSSAASSTAARIREGVAAELKRVRDQATASLEVEEKRLAESGGGGGGEFLRQLRWSELSGTAERIQAYLETRIGDDLELFGTRPAARAPGGSGGHVAGGSGGAAARPAGSGRGRICALDCLKEADEKFGRRQLVEALQWLHERGLANISLRHLSLIVTDLPWFFDAARIAAFDPPLVAGSLLPGLEPDAGVWSEATLAQALKAAGVTSAEEVSVELFWIDNFVENVALKMPHLRRILADSGALVPLAPLRRSAEDERLFYTNLYCAAAAGKPWTGRSGSEPAAYRVYRGIVRPVERALPALFGLTSRLGQLCRCSASGFVRSLWGVEIVVAHVTKSGGEDGAGADGRNGELHLTAWLPVAAASGKMSSAQRAQLLWSALHLFTDALDALLLRQGCLGVQVQSSADGEKEESGEPG
uniref:COR domain-containing protein n=1 Tax=Macrostomum lignano TaxID=282301 RepID=A0A1I8FIN7_9PLAT